MSVPAASVAPAAGPTGPVDVQLGLPHALADARGTSGFRIDGLGARADAYADLPDVEVAAVFGRTLPRVTTIAEAVGAVATGDLRQALDESIDAVDVCLPTPVHPEFVTQALEGGKHVLCETPLALTLDHGQSMLQAAQTAERLLLVGLLMRFVPAYAACQGARRDRRPRQAHRRPRLPAGLVSAA